MKPDKIQKWKENREAALDLYRTTDMNVAQIARTLRLSTTAADIMITGKKLPKFIKEERKKVLVEENTTLNALEEVIVEDAYAQINDIMLIGGIFVKDSTKTIIKSIITNVIIKERDLKISR